MKTIIFTFLALIISSTPLLSQNNKFAIAIHGGAGNFTLESAEQKGLSVREEVISMCLIEAEKMLKEGANAIDVVETVIKMMEDDPAFNAGKGSVMNNNEQVETDAAIMDGKTMKAGAVAALKNVKNPISAARIVMDSSKHVMLVGTEETINQLVAWKVETVSDDYFYVPNIYEKLIELKEIERQKKEKEKLRKQEKGSIDNFGDENIKFGTVGCVVLDKNGNLAAGTSTGGTMNKLAGRVGDSPIIGAGTYANDKVAISCTGVGEFFIKLVAAYDVYSMYQYQNITLQKAVADFVNKKLIKENGAYGGIIAVDHKGNIAIDFNTSGMYRGYLKEGESKVVKSFK